MPFSAIFGAHDAASYVTVDAATAYLAAREGGSAWAAMDGDRPAAETQKRRERLLAAASLLVDTPAYRYGRFFSRERGYVRPQARKFPWAIHPHLFTRASGGTTSTIVATALARPDLYPDGFFVGGSVHVRRGVGIHEARAVVGYEAATGTLDVAPEWDDAPDASTEFHLLWPPDPAIGDAVCEQAYHLLLANPRGEPGELDDFAELATAGIAASLDGVSLSAATGDHPGGAPALCNAARLLLRPYLARSAGAGRA
jgi:hypothetical protein